ncbi:class I SAM-dependent RNA methyltransferase [Telmatospirillum siberiense]|uniref:Class I SAM-dependent RNA methyltransferase n=1 Tax=Telmatospirillum siberiense TaxID=382514 RepID=A0A2N3PUA4_9PROT|nr:TRAM domain-containing protein [Telmatospirillum siberiense]PKU23984.1 class I SAM-dependent RNA methyltransferase [Telmatospirillum siberiense]
MSRKPRFVRPRGKPASALPRTLEIDIDELGGRGDGIGRHDGQSVFVPCTVPGDRVLARVDGRKSDGLAASCLELLSPGPGRVTPVCRHFGECGGCSLQHFEEERYRAWKRGLLVIALRRAGFDEDRVAPMIAVAPGSRRRATFAFQRRRGEVTLGFHARASHQVVDIAGCPLLVSPLLDLLAPLRALLRDVVEDGREGDVVATLTETGIDLLIDADARLDLFDRERLAAFAEEIDLARLSWRRPGVGMVEPLSHRRAAQVRFGDIAVDLPPGSFLQPSIEGERALSALVIEAVGAATPVADLFSGCGSFTFPLAAKSFVHAVEGEAAAAQALKSAAERIGARVSVECRDLAHRPLLSDELKRFHAVVFDPPRVGAAAQAEQLAAAGPPLVVAVSCNPATLARDAKTLVKGGYRLIRATPVDQFPWSAHLEAVAVFER